MSIVDLEKEVQDGIWNFAAQRLLEVDLVSIDHLTRVLCTPCHDDKRQVILNHWDHGMRDCLLLVAQANVNVLLELLWQFLDDVARVEYLRTVDFNKWQLSLLRVQLELVVDILEILGKKSLKIWIIKIRYGLMVRNFQFKLFLYVRKVLNCNFG